MGENLPILSITTATPVASLALVQETLVLSEISFGGGRSHASHLLPAVDFVLHQALVEREALTAIVVCNGPGSFTGLRIGLSFAKGLAESLGVPLILVSSLLGLAVQCELYAGCIVPLLDARRDEYYAAVFKSDRGSLTRLTDDLAVKKRELRQWLQGLGVGECLVTGDAADDASRYGPYLVAPLGVRAPRAGVLGLLARSLPTTDPRHARPNYIRSSSAEPKKGRV
ncbi:MAG: tRNA threonylcarbamoyladenosine biosynthesis protein TsaB [Firmicutes bacterium]|nr:tRNA threonylcarbamoyladenosine biosynthesis protein TsaB [candidate division NPL-UPA2 bacterium]